MMTELEALSLLHKLNPKIVDSDSNQPLYSSGLLDSFDILQLITHIEIETGITIDLVDLLKTNFTASDLSAMIATRVPK